MKKIYNIMTLLACLSFFWACETDRSINPVYNQPESFVLNTPVYASIVTDLQKSTTLLLTTSQPDYEFTAATTYAVQISLNNTWEEETDEAPATFEELATTFTTARMSVDAIDIDKGIVKLAGWKSAEDCNGQAMDIYIRLKATVSSLLPPVYSNSVKITVLPYYIELSDALPATYYLVGSCIGDGSWKNESKANIGVSLIPLSLIEFQEYDKITGTGTFAYTGYFPANQGFKLVGVPGSWNEQWGQNGSAFAHNDGGSGDITVAANGWYKVTLNTATNELKIEPATGSATEFSTMQLVGTFEGWGGNPIVMTKTGGANSHVWYADVTFDADAGIDEGCKFRTDDTWANNWGGDNFPYSITSGKNIPYKAGTYRVVFNDLDNCYFFFINE